MARGGVFFGNSPVPAYTYDDAVATKSIDIQDPIGTSVASISQAGVLNAASGALFSLIDLNNGGLLNGIFTDSAPQSLANGNTVTNSATQSVIAVTNAGAVTGIILAKPTSNGPILMVINEGTGTITFAASGTSNVANGTACIIGVGEAKMFIYSNTTGLWYCFGPGS